jgi:hypothetical protein
MALLKYFTPFLFRGLVPNRFVMPVPLQNPRYATELFYWPHRRMTANFAVIRSSRLKIYKRPTETLLFAGSIKFSEVMLCKLLQLHEVALRDERKKRSRPCSFINHSLSRQFWCLKRIAFVKKCA